MGKSNVMCAHLLVAAITNRLAVASSACMQSGEDAGAAQQQQQQRGPLSGQPLLGHTERQSMQAQLESVRTALNTLVEVDPLPSADAMQTPPPRLTGMGAARAGGGGGLEGLLEGISSRLANIEGMYSDMSTRLVSIAACVCGVHACAGLHGCLRVWHACMRMHVHASGAHYYHARPSHVCVSLPKPSASMKSFTHFITSCMHV